MSYGEGGEDWWFESAPEIPETWNGPGTVVRWGGQSMDAAVRGRHDKIVRWLKEFTPYECSEEELDEIVGAAVNNGDTELAEFLMPSGRQILEYVHDLAQPEAIEWMLEKGYAKKYQDFAASAVVVAAVNDNLDLLQRLARVRNKRRKITRWSREWKFSLGCACRNGNLPMVKWMMEHPLGPDACQGLKDDDMFDDLLRDAAGTGSAALVAYLLDQGCTDLYASALQNASTAGHLDCVKLLLDRSSQVMYAKRDQLEMVVVQAATNDQLEILQFFHTQAEPPTHPCVANEPAVKRRRVEGTSIWWSRTSEAFNKAAEHGHLDLLKWLLENRYEGCTTDAMDNAACNGHLEVVKWLHANTTAGCTKRAMDAAAGNGHLEMMKWLCATRSEGCTDRAFRNAVSNGHLRSAYWFRPNFPRCTPEENRLWIRSRNQFDVVLFLHENCPDIFTDEFGLDTKYDF